MTGDVSDLVPESPMSPEYGPLLSPLEEEDLGDNAGFESLTEELQNIRMEITVIANKIRADAEVAKIESEWKFAAMVNNAIQCSKCNQKLSRMTYLGAGQIMLTSIHCIHRHIVCRDPDCCPSRSSGLKINQNSLHAEIRV